MSVRRLAANEIQPRDFAFTAENVKWAKAQIAKYPEGRQASAVIPLLWRAQEQAGGWVPQKAIEHVADLLAMPKIRALEVATFYTMYNLESVGKFHVQLCGTCDSMSSARAARTGRKMPARAPHVRSTRALRRYQCTIGRLMGVRWRPWPSAHVTMKSSSTSR